MWCMDLTCDLGPLHLRNPVMVASGTFGYGPEYEGLVDLERLGAVVVKGITLREREGNAPPRTVETPAGMLNAIGLQNPGAQAFLDDKLPYLRRFDVPVIVNLNGTTPDEYGELAALFDSADGVAAVEVNISCPNVKHGGMAFSADHEQARAVTRKVRDNTRKPVIVKLSPNVTDIGLLARSVADGGADVLSAINTLVGIVIDPERRRPVLANVTGGLSGPAIRPVAVRCVWEIRRAVKLPIIGMGGITGASDAVQFLLAGASAVAVGTANFVDPQAALRVIDGLAEYLERHGFASPAELVGLAHPAASEAAHEGYHLA
ncbi:MAG: dihydroorotate dehydrogenase [Armatimonadetes bacterium]|nr:dihydroorotate dehydrogenase [Armatimonadota bacterium]